jgi:YHS domain-containing protein
MGWILSHPFIGGGCTLRNIFLMSAAAVMIAGVAEAGPQYVDETTFAVSGYDVVAYHSLEQAPVGQRQPEAVPGKADITAEYNGATWAFASEENRDKFVANPELYAPAFDGHCAYGVAQGGKVPANPNLWRIVDGTLYLNITPNVVGFWEEDIPSQITTAEGNWSGGLEVKDASPKSWKSINANDGTYSTEAPIGG